MLFIIYSPGYALAEKIEAIVRKKLPKAGDTSVIEVWRDVGRVGLSIGNAWRQEIEDALKAFFVIESRF